MKWISVVVTISLLIGILLYSTPAVYAYEPPDADTSIVIEIEITDGEVEIIVDGVTLGAPRGGGGVSLESLANHMGVTKLQKDVAKLSDYANVTGAGLAKVIMLAQTNEDGISILTAEVSNHIPTRLDEQDARLVSLEADAVYQLGRIEVEATYNQELADYFQTYIEWLKADYSAKLTWLIIALSVVIAGLAASSVLLWRRTRI